MKQLLLSLLLTSLAQISLAQSRSDSSTVDTSHHLGEVVVNTSKPLVEVKRGKIVVNVEGSTISTGTTILEILGRSPGVRVDASDNISLRGRPGVTIMLDGKIIPLGGADLANMLKGMSSSTVESIEIITNPGAKWDAAGSSGIINIRTKREKRSGTNGTLTTSYGQGIYPKGMIGINLNNRSGPFNIYGGLTYGVRQLYNHLDITRQFFQSGVEKTKYSQDNNTVFTRKNWTPILGVDYKPGKKTTIGISGTGYLTNVDISGDNFSRVDSAASHTFFSTSNRNDEHWYNYALNAFYRYNIDSTGRELSIDADYARYWSNATQRFTNRYFANDGNSLMSDYLLLGELQGLTQIRSLKADYTHPLRNSARLEGGAKWSFVTADNNPSYYDISHGNRLFDSTKSNHFIYEEQIRAAYMKASSDFGKWSLEAGLRAEQTVAEGEQKVTGERLSRNYTQLFPSVAILRHLDSTNDLGLTLSRRIDRPAYQQLNPFKFFLDPTNYRTGNPLLRPALTWSAELSHTFRQKFITTLTYSYTRDVITEVLQPTTGDAAISFQMDENLAKQQYLGVSISYPFQITKWWSNVTNANCYYNSFYGYLANTQLDRGSLAGDFNITNTFTLPWGLTAELGGYFEAGQVWGYYTTKPIVMLNAGVQKSLWKKAATLKLAATDLTHTGAPRAGIDFRDFHEYFEATRDTRVITLSFVYRFGSAQAGARRLRSGAEAEKRRAGGA
jgi:hypothetical protein